MTTRRAILGAVALFGILQAGAAAAHHGWRWTAEGNFEVVGPIKQVQLGYPHGELIVEFEGEDWLVEIGSPNRNARAGLEDDMIVVGAQVVVSGHRSADLDETRVKAERLYLDGVEYNLYPDRA